MFAGCVPAFCRKLEGFANVPVTPPNVSGSQLFPRRAFVVVPPAFGLDAIPASSLLTVALRTDDECEVATLDECEDPERYELPWDEFAEEDEACPELPE